VATALVGDEGLISLAERFNFKNQTWLTPEGKLVIWASELGDWVPAVQVKDGEAIAWDGWEFKTMKIFGGEVIAADEAVELTQGTALTKDGQMQVFVDREGNIITAANGEIAQGWRIFGFENGALIESDRTWFDWMLTRASHDTIAVNPERSPGLEISVTLNEAAMQGNWDLSWHDQASFIHYWQEIALARMKDDGLIDPEKTYWQFVDWLKEGNVITLKQLSAWNAQTGEVETFANAPVKAVKNYITQMNQDKAGEPTLPLEKTRFKSDAGNSAAYDVAYDPETLTLWLIGEHSREYQGGHMENMSPFISSKIALVSALFRHPNSFLQANHQGISQGGRIYFKEDVGLAYVNLCDWLYGQLWLRDIK
jgi:hypothetical protein